VERCLACEAVVHRETSSANAISVCSALSCTLWRRRPRYGDAVLPRSGSDRKFSINAIQSVDNGTACVMMSPCLPRPRKRGTLHGWRLLAPGFWLLAPPLELLPLLDDHLAPTDL
jgi:hypothetical protein